MKNDEIIIKKILSLLNKLGIDHMITGASAAIYYGRVRLTHDVDIVIELKADQVNKLVQAMPNDFYFDIDSIKEAIENQGQFNIIYGKLGLKFDLWLIKKDEYGLTRFKRKRKVIAYGIKTYMTSPEDLIIVKLDWYKKSNSEKHFEDVLGIYQIQKGNLDEKYIIKWVAKQGTLDLWQKIKEQSI